MATITADMLTPIPLFSQMDDQERAGLFRLMTQRNYAAGTQIVTTDDDEGGFNVVVSGRVEIWIHDSAGKKLVLDVIEPSSFFGELDLLTEGPNSTNATALEDLVTLELERDDFVAFLRSHPDAALDVLQELGNRQLHTSAVLHTQVSRNANDLDTGPNGWGQMLADVIADFSGSIPFLLINLIIFVVWIVLNTLGPDGLRFDPFPFQFLTMSVSLEAIFLSIFVLISQNRQTAKDRIKSDLDYQVNVKSEMELTLLTTKVKMIERQIVQIQNDVKPGNHN